MDSSSAISSLEKIWSQVQQYLLNHVLTWAMAAQLAAGSVAFLLAHRAARALRSWIERLMAQSGLSETDSDRQKNEMFLKITGPFLSFLFLGIAFCVTHHFNWPEEGLRVMFILSIAAFLVRFLTSPTANRYWNRILTSAIWIWTILRLLDIVQPLYSLQESISFTIGQLHFSILTIIKAFLLSLILYWLSKNLLVIIRLWLRTGLGLPPATQVLLYKLSRALLIWISVFLVLHYMGIDLKVFALFGGALGLGIGFGLQKIYANLLGGYMILADKSIKPGDVIQLGNTYGVINFLGNRYVSVITRSGAEHLIPNESLITGELINWSYSNSLLRLQVPVGISYDSDLETATKLMLEAAANTRRVLREPEAICLVTGFGDNGLNLELRVWINDPQNGLGSVKNELLRGVLRRFKEEGIELPYPQLVLHHKSMPGGPDSD
jgi:small-conductance mechanosensitive channel